MAGDSAERRGTKDQGQGRQEETKSTNRAPFLFGPSIYGHLLVVLMLFFGLGAVYGWPWDRALTIALATTGAFTTFFMVITVARATQSASTRSKKNRKMQENNFSETSKLTLKGMTVGVMVLGPALIVLAVLLRLGYLIVDQQSLGLEAILGVLIVLVGVLLGTILFRQNSGNLIPEPNEDPEQNWRPVGGIGAGLMILVGVVILLWPKGIEPTQQWLQAISVIKHHQYSIGALVVGAGLLTLFFAIYEMGFRNMKSKHKVLLSALLRLIGYSIAVAFAWDGKDLAGIAGMGLIVLVTTLLVANAFSEDHLLDRNHLRNAVTLAIIFSFFGLLGFGETIQSTQNSILDETLDHFWMILVAVVGFHFTSISIEAFADRRMKMEPKKGLKDRSTGEPPAAPNV